MGTYERSYRQRGQFIVADRVGELYAMYCEGKSLAEVGKFYGVSKQRVSQLFKMYNMPMRPVGASVKYWRKNDETNE